MGSEDQRKPSQSRFAQTVIEENAVPSHELPVAPAVPRKQTPIGMPAPPAARESHDDVEHVLEVERLERERAQLLAQLQDAEAEKEAAQKEARLLREIAPVEIFPPPSMPPPKPAAAVPVESGASDIKAIEKAILGSRLGRAAVAAGIVLGLLWNAFNTVRSAEPAQKVDAVQRRLSQNEHLSGQEIEAQVLERQRNLQRMRAMYCYFKQLRGASARQGLDLLSLPPGGVTAVRLGDEDPNRPGPPRFVSGENCPEFPPLPPETGAP